MSKTNLPNILIVDDNEKNLHSAKRILEDLPLAAHTAISGEEALREVVNKRFFLILMDVQMPEMDGLEATSLIRGNDKYKDIPIIFMTANNKEEEFIDAGYQEGAVDYLFKPLNPHTLFCKVKVFLDLYQSQLELERRNVELEAYDHMVSHDLKEPLRMVSGFSALLQENLKGKVDDASIHLLEKIKKNMDRASQMLSSILEFTNANKSKELMGTIDLEDCIGHVVENLELFISEKKAIITIENLPHQIEGVQVKVEQLFQNILANALKYQSDDNIPKIEIKGMALPDSNAIEVKIHDNGIGFSQKYADEIFKPFSRLVRKGQYEGSGIGLATCKRISDFHQWHLDVASTEGTGSVFTLTIPQGKKN